jgi:hypothetical protein
MSVMRRSWRSITFPLTREVLTMTPYKPLTLHARQSAAIHGSHVVVDNGINGFTVFRVDNGEVLHTFKAPRKPHHARYQTRFAGSGRWIACASDRGRVYVYDLQNRSTHDLLNHGSNRMIEHITVSRCAYQYSTSDQSSYRPPTLQLGI